MTVGIKEISFIALTKIAMVFQSGVDNLSGNLKSLIPTLKSLEELLSLFLSETPP